MRGLPETVLKDTDWLLLSGNNLWSLNKVPDYLKNITLLNISSSNIKDIDEKVMEVILHNMESLDIQKNKLKTLPKSIVEGNNTNKLWLSDNPYECNCDMIWMKDWLVGAKNVVDKEKIMCSVGKGKGEFHCSNSCFHQH